MLLIVTHSRSAHADRVVQELRGIGTSFFRLDVDKFLTEYRCRWSAPNCGDLERMTSREKVSLESISCVWWYDFPWPSLKGMQIEARFREWARFETRYGLLWALASLNAWFMSRPASIDAASVKTLQWQAAQKVGLLIPETILTNDESFVKGFIECHHDVLFKTIAPLSRERGLKTKGILSTLVTAQDIGHGTIETKMCQFQRFIPKDYDIRVIVIEDLVLAILIDSQSSPLTRVDWRRYDLSRTPHAPYQLPSRVERQCRDLVHALGLTYGAIDLVKCKATGEYYFLEVNPVGLWLWLELLTLVPISHEIAACLTRHTAT